MRYVMDDIIKYVRESLGYGYLRGLFVSSDAVTGDINVEDAEIVTSFFPLGFVSTYHGDDFDVHMGMTKLVIVPFRKNYVIKIPFTGYYTCDWDEGEGEYTNYSLEYERKGTNCCDKEIDIYNSAPDLLQKILMPLEYVGRIDKLKIYIQSKYTLAYEEWGLAYQDDYRKTQTDTKNKIHSKIISDAHVLGCQFEEGFVGSLVEEYGIQNTSLIISMADDYDLFDDMHMGNYGFYNGNHCVVFDYAGYDVDYYYN